MAKFFALYLASLVSGAAVYAVLATGAQPMVGAAGALFGLAGAVLAWEYLDRFSGALSLWPVGRAVVLLLVLKELVVTQRNVLHLLLSLGVHWPIAKQAISFG